MLLEAVPNLSLAPGSPTLTHVLEGLETAHGPGWSLLDVHSDKDHGRTVLTLAGAPAPLVRALHALVDAALEVGDLHGHAGVHPRVGLVDVVPVVALDGARHRDAERVARSTATRLANAGVPVYLYGNLVAAPGQARLALLRKALRGHVDEAAPLPEPPDMGLDRLHPRLGASCVGVRPPLVAYNVLLDTTDVASARAIAANLRGSAPGGLAGVQSLAFPLPTRQGRVQVSCNVTDVEATGLADVYARVVAEAHRRNIAVKGGELVGLAPAACLADDPAAMGLATEPISLEDALEAAGLRNPKTAHPLRP